MSKIYLNKITKGLFVVALISFIFMECLILINGVSNEKEKVDYIVVLGAGLKYDKLSPILRDRLIKTLEYGADKNIPIVVSGGQGEDEALSEASAMKNYLIINGIDKKRIIMEDKSTSTYENLKFTNEILSKINGNKTIKIAIVTNRFHQFRSKLIAKNLGLKPYSIVSYTDVVLIPKYYIREYFALMKTIIKDL